MTSSSDFYPRPPRGGRPVIPLKLCGLVEISIHALREEGDRSTMPLRFVPCNFYPRPPRGGRRVAVRLALSGVGISIHALREEGDSPGSAQRSSPFDFYPRPPRGGRLCRTWPRSPAKDISIHALREEGDMRRIYLMRSNDPFLSTPSARRATAKTETKALFSNKLYNILHEFRRALIYNGSKSYPNHAK